MTPTTNYEPFTAAFTGHLKTFVSADGKRFRLDGKGAYIEKDRRYMLKQEGVQLTFLPILHPEVRI